MKTEQAQAAALIRKELKKHGIKASVTSASGSMTSSVRVQLADLVAPWTLKAIESFCNKFQMGHFDGMVDMYEYSNTNDDLPQAKFVFVSNGRSDDDRQRAYDYLRASFAGYEDKPEKYEDAANEMGASEWVSTEVHRVLCGAMGEFWTKPKVDNLANI